MDRETRRLSHLKRNRIKSVLSLPLNSEGVNGDQIMVNGRLYVKDNNRWIDIASQSQVRNTHIFTYGDPNSTAIDYYVMSGQVRFSSTKGYVMHKDGSILSHSTSVKITTATSDDVTFEIRINDVNQSLLENEFLSSLGTGEKSSYVNVDFGRVPFSAGDFIGVKANETGTMVWDDVLGYVEIGFNS